MAGKKYLIDTHCLLWFQENNPKIPKRVMREIQNPENAILFSQLSLYEIAIKLTIGKLPDFRTDVDEVYHQAVRDGFLFLNIQNQHIFHYHKIPLHEQHRDPFDRLLIATAFEENAIMITVDKNFQLYTEFIQVFW